MTADSLTSGQYLNLFGPEFLMLSGLVFVSRTLNLARRRSRPSVPHGANYFYFDIMQTKIASLVFLL